MAAVAEVEFTRSSLVLLHHVLRHAPYNASLAEASGEVDQTSFIDDVDTSSSRAVSWQPAYFTVPNHTETAVFQLGHGRGETDTHISRT